MRAGYTYTHPGLLDTVMEVTKVQYRHKNYDLCKVLWYSTRGLFLGADKVKVPRTNRHLWKVIR